MNSNLSEFSKNILGDIAHAAPFGGQDEQRASVRAPFFSWRKEKFEWDLHEAGRHLLHQLVPVIGRPTAVSEAGGAHSRTSTLAP